MSPPFRRLWRKDSLAPSYSRTLDPAKLTLIHEEIAQMTGEARETATRLFSDFKKKQLLKIKGSTLILRYKAGFEYLANDLAQ